MQEIGKKPADGVRLALLNNRLQGVARKMANTLLRTGRSGVLNIARDFSCAIVTANCELAATAESLPIHVLSGPDLMARAMKTFHPDLKRGDAFLHNSPYHGCSHPADHTLLVPVIDGQGVHRFTVVAKAHQADCGNSQPTTYMGAARDVYEEGALIFPAVRVQSNYRDNDDIIRMCRMRIRVPDQWWGDYLAMSGAARIGERELLALGEEIGWDSLEAHTREFFDYSEQRMISAIRKMPAGRTSHSSRHDPFPGTPPDGIEVTARVHVDPEAAVIEVDLRDNPDCLPCGLNLSEACARTSAMIGVFNSLDPTVPKNAGAFRRLRIHLREGCIVGIPRHPTSCSVATTNLADRVANSVQAAMADLGDGLGLAECGAVIPPAVGVISGKLPGSGAPFVNQVFLGCTGGAGAPAADAWQTICHVGNAGLCFQDSVELDELRQPIMVYERRFVPDTEGAGRSRGAHSIFVEFGPVGCDVEIGYGSDGAINAAKGVRGGLSGAAGRQSKVSRNGQVEALPGCALVAVLDGERIRSHSCGGGGYGSPLERDPNAVLRDVAEGWISPARAEDVYKVCIDESGAFDTERTAARRKGM
ncbi:N-methylhydantoinase B [Roseiarcus fermentans]|uniref:N-methylhydantoinase B n=1 Tax=Roseiarcus fermentans TaxID=1473586 RepID=A0A366FJU1_9HYPH|nr:hydantoinase B/oxoprolinase family protein [Roseiarcus fermentans]RBP13989.1 N-methylhydantoinase B [Roseiarcus fermentans]